MSREIVLHLGVHRTASTRLQADLDANLALLAGAGIVALTPPRPGRRAEPTIRDLARSALKAAARSNPLSRHLAFRALRRELDTLIANAAGADLPPRRVILSDELLLGPAFAPGEPALYPRAARRLAAIRRLLRRDPSEIHLTLRAYDSFIVSVYAMRAVHAGPLPPFSELAPTLLAFARGWPELVDTIAKTFPAARLVVSTFENRSIAARLADLVGTDIQSRSLASEVARLNAAPTFEAIEAARALGTRCPDPDALTAAHAGGTRFDPLSEDEKDHLAARYAADLERLRVRPGLELGSVPVQGPDR